MGYAHERRPADLPAGRRAERRGEQGGDSQVAWIAGAGASIMMGRNELFADLSRNVGPVIRRRDRDA